ncbi:MAG: ATP-dependent helicase [Nitrospirae bacterium]|nr:ATP-dependent helicase [Nitrospirota bacterium]
MLDRGYADLISILKQPCSPLYLSEQAKPRIAIEPYFNYHNVKTVFSKNLICLPSSSFYDTLTAYDNTYGPEFYKDELKVKFGEFEDLKREIARLGRFSLCNLLRMLLKQKKTFPIQLTGLKEAEDKQPMQNGRTLPQDGFDPSQWEAALLPLGGRKMIISPAGSGKTTYVVYKRIQEITKEAGGKSLFLVFNKSVRLGVEGDRTNKEHSFYGANVDIHTFHSFGAKYIYKNKLCSSENDPEDLEKKIKHAMEQVAVKNKKILEQIRTDYKEVSDPYEVNFFLAKIENNSTYKDESLLSDIIDREKRSFLNTPQSLAEYIHANKADWSPTEERHYRNILALYRAYETGMGNDPDYIREKRFIDFSDMLAMPVRDWLRNPETYLNSFHCDDFSHLFVDEFQDLDFTQIMMVEVIGNYAKEVFVIGDDDQVVYEWRGSSVETFLRYPSIQPSTGVHYLKFNHRCPGDVVIASDNVIKKNKRRFAKQIQPNPDRKSEATIELLDTTWDGTGKNINRNVVQEMQRLIEVENVRPSRLVLVGLTNDLLRRYLSEFKTNGISSYILREEGSLQDGKVCLISVHTVKGRTFDYVFLCTDGFYARRNSDQEAMRRLFYVGLTRAAKKLYISLDKRKNPLTGELFTQGSTFLEEAGIIG